MKEKQTKARQDRRQMDRVGVVGYNKAELKQNLILYNTK